MPKEQFSGIEMFSVLNKEQISSIINILDENIIKDPTDSTILKKLEALGFTRKESSSILEAFFNFYLALPYPDRMREFINQLDISKDTRQLILETFEKIKEKGDISKVVTATQSEDLKIFGHDHLHNLQAIAEFRPVTFNNKLQKMVVSIIVDGEIQDNAHNKPKTINFQTDFKNFETMVQSLNKQLKNITSQIKILKEKLGSDIIDT